MKTVKGYHGEWNMGSPGGWEYQRIAQMLGKTAWDLIQHNIEVDVEIDFEHPMINAVPGFARMLLRAHKNHHGTNAVHAVLLAETETLDVVFENKNFVDYLNSQGGVKASLADPGHLSLKNGKVFCKGTEATVIFMDFNLDTLVKIGKEENIKPIEEAIKQGILVNPRGMEPLGAKGMFEVFNIAMESGNYIVQQLVPLGLWSEQIVRPMLEERSLFHKIRQTDFRCFITDEGLQGFLARFGGVPTNVGSGGGVQPLAILNTEIPPAEKLSTGLTGRC